MQHRMRPLTTCAVLATVVGLLFASGCDDAEQGQNSLVDAALVSDGSIDAGTGPSDAGRPDASAESEPARTPLPAMPSRFTIRFETGPCLGSCPVYQVSIDQDGVVRYVGGFCTARPGVFDKQVPAAQALSLYASLTALSFGDLPTEITPPHGACGPSYSDNPWTTWTVEVEGRTKTIDLYRGCTRVPPDAMTLEELEPELQMKTGIAAWTDAPSDCSRSISGMDLMPSYQLAEAQAVVGTLKFGGFRWDLFDCAMMRLAGGIPIAEEARVILHNEDNTKISWDGGMPLGSIVLAPGIDGGFTATGVREDAEVALTVTPGDGC